VPFETVSHRLAIAYLIGIGLSVLALTEGEL
jgi:hypothetical protein